MQYMRDNEGALVSACFQRLYTNSGTEMGTIRYFHEKMQGRNVTKM